ncbi:hypothetical protein [Singulisphaera sp. PoT]|uniref:hypothetical protein n=1 Tax=Singulisphaera sp. PoT TaxID=3411797 RepID=UPI003BF59CFA
METKRNLERLAKMTPEQLEALERLKASNLIPERREEDALEAGLIREEFPPLQRDHKTIEP